MADETTATLELRGNASHAIKEIARFNNEVNKLRAEALSAGRAYDATEKSVNRVTDALREQLRAQQRVNAESAKQRAGAVGNLRAGAGEVAREVAQGSPLAPVIEGVASLTPVGIAAGVAAAGAAFALGELQKSLEKSREAAKQATERILENARTQDEINKLLSQGQYTNAQTAATAELEKQTALQKEVQLLEQRRAELQAQYDQADLIGKLDFRGKIDDVATSLEEKQTALQAQMEKTAAAYTALNTDLGQSAKVAEDYNKAVETFVEKDKERKAAEDALLVTMAALEAQEKALNEAYTKGVIARSAARGRADARANEDRDLAAERAAEDLAEALEAQERAHQANLESIVQRGQDAIADVYAAIAERQMQAAKQVADLQRQYNEEQLRAEQTFGIERSRALEDYQREVARAAEDLRVQLRDLRLERDRAKQNAILDNDVLAFLTAQQDFEDNRRGARRDFRRDSRRGAEDFERDEQRASEDFARENEERRKAHEARLSEIQAELAEFIASSYQKIAQIEAQTQQELALAQATYEEQLRIDQEQRDKINRRADEDLQRSLDRLREDRETEDAAARTAHTAALGRIEEQRTAQESALNVLIAKAEELRQKALALSFGGAGTPGTTPLPSTAPYVPSPGSEKFYEDPKQGAAGGGGGGFGAGLSGTSSVGGGLTVNVQPRVMSMGGVEYVPREDFDALIETIKAALSEKEVNL